MTRIARTMLFAAGCVAWSWGVAGARFADLPTIGAARGADETPADAKLEDETPEDESAESDDGKPADKDVRPKDARPKDANAKPADEPADEPTETRSADEIRRLIVRLGDDQYVVREQASEELGKLGFAAFGALEDGARHADREIRYRSQRILIGIRQQVFEQRLEAFLNDDDDDEAPLPGWPRVKKRLGDGPSVRTLFVEMQRSEPQLMRSLETGGKSTSEALRNRIALLQQAMQLGQNNVSQGTIVALLFAAGEDDVDAGMQIASPIYQLCYQQTFRNAITAGNSKDLVRKLLGAWIRRGEDWVAYQGLMLAMQYDLTEGLVPAEKALKNPQGPSHVRQYAILAIGRFGADEHRALLLPLLNDKTVCLTWQMNNVTIQTQVRDVALAVLLHLHKKDPKQFGFERLQPQPPYIFNPSTLGFKSEEERGVVLKKWEEFQLAEKNAAKAAPKPAATEPAKDGAAKTAS